MFHRLREPFGKAGLIVAILALVMALVGGAYAASSDSGDATASAKRKGKAKKKRKGVTIQQVRRIARQEARKFASAGPQGPQGVPGLPGAPGADGQNGSNGSNGSDGTNGTDGADGNTVLNGFGAPGALVGTVGDFYIDTDSQTIYGPKIAGACPACWGSGTPLRGTNGSPWTAGGTLPVGSTQTGAWSLTTVADDFGSVGHTAISFPIPLAAALDDTKVKTIAVGGTPPDECNDGVAPAPSVDNPEADSGFLCVFAGFGSTMGMLVLPLNGPPGFLTAQGASTAGAIVLALTGSDDDVLGSFAVTG